MGKKSSPKAPDPSSVAAAQGAANKEAVTESAKVNQINQVTPQGSITYSGEIGSPDRTVTTSLSPAEQQQLDQQNQVASTLGGRAIGLADQVAGQGDFNYNGFKEVPDNYDQLRKDATDKVYQGLTQNFDRDYGRAEDSLRTRLAAQGLNANDEAFKREIQTFDEGKGNALNQASATAFQYGQGEGNNAYNTDTATRNRQIAEATNLRNTPINELSAILQGTPALNATGPNQTNTGQYSVAPAPVAGSIYDSYNSQLAAQKQRAEKLGGTINPLVQAGATAAFASASAIKENKEQIPDDDSILQKLLTLPIEYWSYKADASEKIQGDNQRKHIGCYAEDFRDTFGIGDGMTINFVDCMGVIMQSIKELAEKVERLSHG